jgi:hypothetical protein
MTRQANTQNPLSARAAVVLTLGDASFEHTFALATVTF